MRFILDKSEFNLNQNFIGASLKRYSNFIILVYLILHLSTSHILKSVDSVVKLDTKFNKESQGKPHYIPLILWSEDTAL